MTVTGIITTVVISGTPSATGEPSPLGQGATNKAGLSTGKVVGIVLGVALGLGIMIGLAVWFWLRRKHQNQSRGSSRNGGFSGEDADTSRTTPSRQVSQMSSSDLLGKGPRILTNGYALSNGFNNPRSPDTVSSNGIDRRSMGTDQRLNPYALYAHEEAHLSSVSLQDNQDYSRQLRVANPD
jgi:cell wall integrity and stress response component